MKEMTTKIAELKFEAPLASFEEEESTVIKTMNIFTEHLFDISLDTNFVEKRKDCPSAMKNDAADIIQEGTFSPFSGSLEDLVNTFDDKITSCFRDYGTNVESLAPVQVRSQEEIMHECQMWWTITGTFGNILPIDWSKSYSRKLQVPSLNLTESVKSLNRIGSEDFSSEDEAVATDLDMHTLILTSRNDRDCTIEPVKTADEVLKEIDDIIQESSLSELSLNFESMSEINEVIERSKEVLSSPLHEKHTEKKKMDDSNFLHKNELVH